MAESRKETERKYDVPPSVDASWLPDLTGVDGIEAARDGGTSELDAVYYDTADLRLHGSSATVRRRTGGSDAGWHLKLPLPGGDREEIAEPLSDGIPDTLRDMALSRTRGAELMPVARIRTSRHVQELVGEDDTSLAELSIDRVWADALADPSGHASWTEMEVELTDHGDRRLLDALDKRLRKEGIDRAGFPSKLARALGETGVAETGRQAPPDGVVPGSAGEQVLEYLRERVDLLVALDPAVRRDRPDSVHQMRVSCRRLRNCLRSYRSVLDREVTDPIRQELRWLAQELGAARDQEVLHERLSAGIGALPDELVLGPVEARLRAWNVARSDEARQRTLAALATPRYADLLDALAALTARPPLRRKASGKPGRVLGRAILKEHERLAARIGHALELPPGKDRDAALHQARKAAKRVRYAAETAGPALGKPTERLGKRVKAVQKVLGDHQDAVVARKALRDLAVAAHAAGESGFTWGLLYGQEQAGASARQRQLPEAWTRASKGKLRRALGH